MAFDISGRVWLGNDGGVYRRDNVTAGAGQWVSLNAGLRTTEVTGVAYDRITKALIIGQQDNGTAVMDPNVNVNTAFASKVFSNFRSGDGGKVAADPLNVGAATVATNVSRYSSAQYLSGLTNRQYSSTNTFISSSTPTLTVIGPSQSLGTYENAQYGNLNGQGTGTIQFLQPIAINKVEGGRLYIGTRRIYESINQGGTLQDLNGDLAASAGFAGGTSVHALNVNAMEAGGRTGVTAQPNVLYVGTSSLNSNTGHTDIGGQVFVRPATGAAQTAVTRLTAYSTTAGTTSSSSAVQALAMDTANWQNVYVAAPTKVWFGNVAVNGASSTWSDFTGNLTPGGTVFTEPTGTFTAMSFVPVSGGGGRGAVIVGTSGGLFYRYTDGLPNSWLSLNGTNMPNAYFSELQYDAADDILIASTLGRGVWTLSGASAFFVPVPEPATILGISVASLGLGGFVRRRLRRETVPAVAA